MVLHCCSWAYAIEFIALWLETEAYTELFLESSVDVETERDLGSCLEKEGGSVGRVEKGDGQWQWVAYQLSPYGYLPTAAILDDPMECSRGERLSITLAKNRINRAPERLGKAKVEVDIFELLRDSEYETAETST